MVVRGMLETLPAYREGFAKAGGNFHLVVLSSMAMGAASAAEAAGVPRLTLHMQPALFRSIYECPVFLQELSWLARSPRWVKSLFFRLVDVLLWEKARKGLNAFRKSLESSAVWKIFMLKHSMEAKASPLCFRIGTLLRSLTGLQRSASSVFPLRLASHVLCPQSLENFLSSGEPPVAWTHGSANFDIQHFQSRALAISQELKLRCLLLSMDPPDGLLPAGAFHIAHARFEDLFPRCCAVVHHGGIGTTAKCIAAGVPQLIIPRSHDQPDNAARIVRLGLGNTFSYRPDGWRKIRRSPERSVDIGE